MTSEQLEQRLRTGEQMIEAERDPNRRMELEDFWSRLLADYKRLVDQERRAESRAA